MNEQSCVFVLDESILYMKDCFIVVTCLNCVHKVYIHAAYSMEPGHVSDEPLCLVFAINFVKTGRLNSLIHSCTKCFDFTIPFSLHFLQDLIVKL